jgi:hypothetical protein
MCLRASGHNTRSRFLLYPLTVESAVAHLEHGLSLAETIMVHEGRMDAELNWQQQLDLNDGILTFRVKMEDKEIGPDHGGFFIQSYTIVGKPNCHLKVGTGPVTRRAKRDRV